jgi:hypothetical protein
MFWWMFVFLVYWLILFVICYVVSDYSQKFLYDESTPYIGLKIAGGTFLMAILMAWFKPSFDSMFTTQLHWTLLQAIVWVAVFILVFRFHPTHAAAIGLGTFVVTSGLATIGVESLMGNTPEARRVDVAPVVKPLRKPAYPTPLPPLPVKKDAEPPQK